MSQAEADSDHGGTKHDLLLRVGASLNAHRRWLVAITGGLLPGVVCGDRIDPPVQWREQWSI